MGRFAGTFAEGCPVVKITKRYVDALRPGKADAVYWDDELPGFGVRVRPSGSRTFIFQGRIGKGRAARAVKVTLGNIAELTPHQARDLALEARSKARSGVDPVEATQDANLTVSALVARYLAEGPSSKPRKKASSWATDRSNLTNHVVPLLGRRHVASLTRADIEKFQAKVTAGATRANRKGDKPRGSIRVRGGKGIALRATLVLGATLAWAIDHGCLKGTNPAKGVQLNKLQKRERFLSDAEVRELGEALSAAEAKGVNSSTLAIIRLLLLTGARRNEIAGLQWAYVDFQRAALLLPDSKTGQKTIPLGAPALEILSRLRSVSDKAATWVFPATHGDSFNVGVNGVWRSIAKAAGLTGVRLHDLRHTFASVSVAGNNSLYIIGKILGHRKTETTEKYAHLQLDPVRAVADQTARRIADNLERRTGKVVPLKERK
jgi:integrase